MDTIRACGRAWVLLAACASGALQAAPFVPADDDEIVQRLPGRMDTAARAQRARWAGDPRQLPLALATARAAIDRARHWGDPRELGLAQAALAPWWDLADPPPAARLLRATVRQSQHDFAAALRDLDVLARGGAGIPMPVQAQAGLTRAAVLQVTGRLGEAMQACDALTVLRYAGLGAALETAALACTAELRSLQGQARRAAAELAALARQAPGNAWLALVRAELAERLGDEAAATAFYRAALAGDGGGEGGSGVYAVAACADWLLDRGRPADALALLGRADTEADALLLRRAIARQRLHDPRAGADAAALKQRFAAARLRGETFHEREQARLALDVDGDAAGALALAQANWARQKEPADALLLLRAALAAGRAEAAEPVFRLRQAGWTDVRLDSAIGAATSPSTATATAIATAIAAAAGRGGAR